MVISPENVFKCRLLTKMKTLSSRRLSLGPRSPADDLIATQSVDSLGNALAHLLEGRDRIDNAHVDSSSYICRHDEVTLG